MDAALTGWRLRAVLVLAVVLRSEALALDKGRIRTWLESRHQSIANRAALREPLVIEWTRLRTSRLALTEIDSRLGAIERFPDHPDRSFLEQHRSLQNRPEETTGRMVLLDSSTWMLEEHHSNGYTLKVGGSGGARWMLAGLDQRSQLTIIKAGTAFPAAYNIGRFYEVAVQYQSILLDAWLNHLPDSISITSIETNGSEWRALVRTSGGPVQIEVRGEWCRDQPRIVSMSMTDSAQPDEPATTRLAAEYASSAGECEHPARVIIDQPDALREVYVINSVRTTSPATAVAFCELPDVPVGTPTLDFRRDDSPAWNMYSELPRLMWSVRDGTDAYETLPSYDALDKKHASPQRRLQAVAGVSLGIAVLVVTGGIAWRRLRR